MHIECCKYRCCILCEYTLSRQLSAHAAPHTQGIFCCDHNNLAHDVQWSAVCQPSIFANHHLLTGILPAPSPGTIWRGRVRQSPELPCMARQNKEQGNQKQLTESGGLLIQVRTAISHILLLSAQQHRPISSWEWDYIMPILYRNNVSRKVCRKTS